MRKDRNHPWGCTRFLNLEQTREKRIRILCHEAYINASGPHLLLPSYFWSTQRTQKPILPVSIAASTWNPTPCSYQQKILKQNENLEGERCVLLDFGRIYWAIQGFWLGDKTIPTTKPITEIQGGMGEIPLSDQQMIPERVSNPV